MRKTVLSTVTVALTLAAAGCWWGRSDRSTRKARPRERGRTYYGKEIDFDKYWPREEVVKLSPAQRARLLELSLAGLEDTNWEHARDNLLALGKDAIEPLIERVESTKPTSAAAGPLPVTKVKTLGELAHDILLQSIQYHSNYKGQLPARSKAAWKEWWGRNRAGLTINK